MCDFPPLPSTQGDSTSTDIPGLPHLLEVFPGLESGVVEMVLDECLGDVLKATEYLLRMNEEVGAESSISVTSVRVDNDEYNGFKKAVDTLCDSDDRPPISQPTVSQTPLRTDESVFSSTQMEHNPRPASPDVSHHPSLPTDQAWSPDHSSSSNNENSWSSNSTSSSSPLPMRTDSSRSRVLTETKSKTNPKHQSPRFLNTKPQKESQSSKTGLPPGPLQDLNKGHPVLVILRGLPGSGKSTLAAKFVKNSGVESVVLSTDQFFLQPDGSYKFRPDKLQEAHLANQRKAADAVKKRLRMVIIDNTNTEVWEMREYVSLGVTNGYRIHIVEPNTGWKFNARQLASRNSHGVPIAKIKVMLDRYERNVSLPRLLSMWHLVERNDSEEHDENLNETDDIFESDDNDETPKAATSSLTLDPSAPIFVPDHNPEELLQTDAGSTSEYYNNANEVEHLASVFPQLSVAQAESLYHQKDDQFLYVDNEPNISTDQFSYLDSESTNMTVQFSDNGVTNMTEQPAVSLKMPLDPLFAVSLQEVFGSPLDDSLLQFLDTEDLLTMEIPQSLALHIFSTWQASLQAKLSSKPVLENRAQKNEPPLLADYAEVFPSIQPPKTVLAPNAVDYYEKEAIEKAVEASMRTCSKPATRVVVASSSGIRSPLETPEEEEEGQLELYKEKRDQLYRKVREASNTKIRGAAGYYAAQARELNGRIKKGQRQKQMDDFIRINSSLSSNKLDLHFLQTGDAIKQLSDFLGQKEASLSRGGYSSENETSVEVITGKGNRSDKGRSRLRPAVQIWLEQKGYQFTQVNSGAFKVTVRGGQGEANL